MGSKRNTSRFTRKTRKRKTLWKPADSEHCATTSETIANRITLQGAQVSATQKSRSASTPAAPRAKSGLTRPKFQRCLISSAMKAQRQPRDTRAEVEYIDQLTNSPLQRCAPLPILLTNAAPSDPIERAVSKQIQRNRSIKRSSFQALISKRGGVSKAPDKTKEYQAHELEMYYLQEITRKRTPLKGPRAHV